MSTVLSELASTNRRACPISIEQGIYTRTIASLGELSSSYYRIYNLLRVINSVHATLSYFTIDRSFILYDNS